MVKLPYVMGPADDWDPQGYNADEEAEDTLTPGMHFLDGEDEEAEGTETAVETEESAEAEEEDAEDTESSYADEEKDPIEELDELANTVIESERDTIRYNDYADEEE